MTSTPTAAPAHHSIPGSLRVFLSPRSLIIGVLLLSTSDILTYRTAAAQAVDPHRRLYENRELFNQLSGAARTLLELRYGKKHKEKAETLKGDSAEGQQDPKEYVSPDASEPLLAFIGLEEPLSAISNTLVNDPAADTTAQDTQSETTIVLGAGSNVIVSFNDSGSFIGGAQKLTGFSRSTDGGASFTDQGTLPTNASGDAGDPVLARDPVSGTIYLSTLFFTGSGMQVFRSFDNGASFTAPVNGGLGFGGGDFLDKEWIAVDNFSGPGQGNVYLVFRNFAGGGSGSRPTGIYLTRSTDGGSIWGPSGGTPIVPAAFTQGAFVSVGPDHTVYVFWLDRSTLPARILIRKSTDLGVTFGSTIMVATLVGTGVSGDLGLNGGFRTNSFPQAAVNPANGNIYVVYNDRTTGVDRGNIYFRQSTDSGATWGAAVQLNTDLTSNDQWQPALAVTPDGSRLFVGWYDRRLDPANSLIDTFGVIGTISGSTVTFGQNFLITTQSFPVVRAQDPVVNSTYMGDYDVATADNSFFYYTWGDNRRSDSFHTNQPDVRFTKLPVAGPGPILLFESAAISGGNANGAIDVNECNNLSVTLRNLGTSAASGVSGTLSFNTSGVTIAQPTSAYPDIAVGGTGTNTTSFQISTSSGFACGTNIPLTLTVTTASGTFTIPFQLTTGLVGPAIRFDNNTPTTIPDLTTTESPIAVSGITGAIGKVTVSFQINHTFDADLDIFLVAPDGTTIQLTTDNGDGGANYGTACTPDTSRTTFDDAASTPITSGFPPFVGTFRPEGALSTLIGKSGSAVNGTWKLRITDSAVPDIGTLNCWSLFISPKTCADGGGVCPIPPPTGTRLTNISTRGFALTGDNIMIGGFIIGGSAPKTVLVRGRGPSMGGPPFNVPGTLVNPFLRLFSGPTVIADNDNWQATPNCASGFACGGATEITATGLDPCQPNPGQTTPPPGCTQESAILITLPPGGYTSHLFGASGGTGVALVEVFEVDGTTPKLLNISTRGFALTGDNIMIGGFIIGGSAPKTVLLRGRGPSMGGPPFFVPGTLVNPFLRLFSGSTLIATNDNWQDPPNCPGFVCGGATEITATGLDPCQPNPGQTTTPLGCTQESAILITLPPGGYTTHLFGASGGTGVGLVEVFEVN